MAGARTPGLQPLQFPVTISYLWLFPLHMGLQPGVHVSLLRSIHFKEDLRSLTLGWEHGAEIAAQGRLLFYSIFLPPVTQRDV